jgi:hypothetical protein
MDNDDAYQGTIVLKLRGGITDFERETSLDHARRVIGVKNLTPRNDDPNAYDVELEKTADGLKTRFGLAFTGVTLSNSNIVPNVYSVDMRPTVNNQLQPS